MQVTPVSSYEGFLELLEGNVLLINPPVIDSRYPWSKWNQPIDLLKIGAFVLEASGLKVRLYDFLLPNQRGKVVRLKSPILDNENEGYPARFWFGRSLTDFDDYLDNLTIEKWIPGCVVVTSLTSFWWEGIPFVSNSLKNRFPDAQIILIGNYPIYEESHVKDWCPTIDQIATKPHELPSEPSTIDLYTGDTPRFLALDLMGVDPLQEIHSAIAHGIKHFTFFNSNLFSDFRGRLKPLLQEVIRSKLDIWFHAICGVELESFPLEHAELFAKARFAEFHFEPVIGSDGLIDEEPYREVLRAFEIVGLAEREGMGWRPISKVDLSGFVWIGKPSDEIEAIAWNMLKTVQLFGMAIPKPFSPTPGTNEFDVFASFGGGSNPRDISPHQLPFAEHNGIGRDEYKELFRLSALLNLKVRSHSFDFLGDSFLVQQIRKSFRERRWDI